MQAWEVSDGQERAIIYAETVELALGYAIRSIWKKPAELEAKRRPTLDHFYNGSMTMTKFGTEERKALDKLGWGLGPF